VTDEKLDTEPKMLWEILVPTERNPNDEEKNPYRLRYHRVWDERVKAIAGGLTVLTPVRGTWVSDENEETFKEKMIPVRIMCTRSEIMEIAEMTKKYYAQLAVMVYKISDEVHII